MSKKTKKSSKSKPAMRPDGLPAIEMYAQLPLDNKTQNDCLVLDKQGVWFHFPSTSHCTIVSAGIEHKFGGFSHFDDNTTIGEVEAWHAAIFGGEPPDQDLTLTRLAVWKGLCGWEKTNQRMEKPTKIDPETGVARGKKLANRLYVLCTETWNVTIPQAMACLRILRDNVAKNDQHPDAVGTVLEETLKAKIYERQSELHTKQDAWRIFQYYRPRLIEAKILRLV